MKFRKYVRSRRRTDDAVGDFIGDAKADRSFPDVKSWGRLERYLISRGACTGATRAAKTLWCDYERECGYVFRIIDHRVDHNLLCKITSHTGHAPTKKALLAFAKLNDWTHVDHGAFGLHSLKLGARGRTDFLNVSGMFDHGECFTSAGRPVAIVGQPYDHSDFADEIKRLSDFAVHVPPAPLASFHYPGRCHLFVVTRPGQEVQWLPEQISGCYTSH